MCGEVPTGFFKIGSRRCRTPKCPDMLVKGLVSYMKSGPCRYTNQSYSNNQTMQRRSVEEEVLAR